MRLHLLTSNQTSAGWMAAVLRHKDYVTGIELLSSFRNTLRSMHVAKRRATVYTHVFQKCKICEWICLRSKWEIDRLIQQKNATQIICKHDFVEHIVSWLSVIIAVAGSRHPYAENDLHLNISRYSPVARGWLIFFAEHKAAMTTSTCRLSGVCCGSSKYAKNKKYSIIFVSLQTMVGQMPFRYCWFLSTHSCHSNSVCWLNAKLFAESSLLHCTNVWRVATTRVLTKGLIWANTQSRLQFIVVQNVFL